MGPQPENIAVLSTIRYDRGVLRVDGDPDDEDAPQGLALTVGLEGTLWTSDFGAGIPDEDLEVTAELECDANHQPMELQSICDFLESGVTLSYTSEDDSSLIFVEP